MAFESYFADDEECDRCRKRNGQPVLVLRSTTGRGLAAENHVLFLHRECLTKAIERAEKNAVGAS